MNQLQQKSTSMVFVLVVSAVFLAVTTFIAVLLLGSRPTAPETTALEQTNQLAGNAVTVGGAVVFLNPDPAQTIILVSEMNPPAADPNVVIIPTNTPVPTVAGPPPTPIPTAAPTRDPNPVIFIAYTVMQGDSLYSIADAQNSSIELMAKHGIDDDDLVPGTVLQQLPIANPAYCPGSRAYVVRDLDTVFRIAAQFGTTVEAIRQLNGIDENFNIDVTQVICIPL